MPKNCKKIFFCFKQISKCNSCIYIHFSRAFQKYGHILYKTFFKLLFIKSQKFCGDSVKNESARTEKLQGVPNSKHPRFSVTKFSPFRWWVVRIEKVGECYEC